MLYIFLIFIIKKRFIILKKLKIFAEYPYIICQDEEKLLTVLNLKS